MGLTTFLAILVFLTAIFNWFWTGTGADPTRTFYAPFTNNFKEFQEYATLYIALLAFGATMFAGLAVFLVFSDWKEQHNQSVDAKYYTQALESFKKISTTVRKFKTLYEKCSYINNNDHNSDIEYFKEKYQSIKDELLQNLDSFQSELIFLQSLNQDDFEISVIEIIFSNYIKISKDELTNTDISLKYYNSMTDYEALEEDLKNISEIQGGLIINNIKFIVEFLNSKIKAK